MKIANALCSYVLAENWSYSINGNMITLSNIFHDDDKYNELLSIYETIRINFCDDDISIWMDISDDVDNDKFNIRCYFRPDENGNNPDKDEFKHLIEMNTCLE